MQRYFKNMFSIYYLNKEKKKTNNICNSRFFLIEHENHLQYKIAFANDQMIFYLKK